MCAASSLFPQLIFGYHGCDSTIGERVITRKMDLKPSANHYDWLGSGIYFWENAPQRALLWAKECKENPEISKGSIADPFVLGSIIDPGVCLNLTDIMYVDFLKEAYDILKKILNLLDMPMPENTGSQRNLDCLLINFAINQAKSINNGNVSFDTVRGAFIEGDPIYPGAKLHAKTHIQICVRNPDSIKGYFYPQFFDE